MLVPRRTALLGGLAATLAAPALAQGFPTRPVRIVVPIAPGGANDLIARMVSGLGIGITSTLCPLYNAEIAPARYRGRLVALNQLAIVTGIFLTYFANSGIASMGSDAWDISTGWRWMFGVGAIPGIIFMALLFLVPESPRWLIKQGKPEKALNSATMTSMPGTNSWYVSPWLSGLPWPSALLISGANRNR